MTSNGLYDKIFMDNQKANLKLTEKDNEFRRIEKRYCNGTHIGRVSSYPIDENYEWIGEIKDCQTFRLEKR